MAIPVKSDQDHQGASRVLNLQDPVDAQEAATKQFVLDNASGGGGSADIPGRNETGVTLVKGSVVYGQSYSVAESQPLLAMAIASDPQAVDALGIIKADLATATTSTTAVQNQGVMSGLDTSTWVEGDSLWVSHLAYGGLINYPPPSAYAKKVGKCLYSHATAGVIYIFPTATVLASGGEVEGTGVLIRAPYTISNQVDASFAGVFTDDYGAYEISVNDYRGAVDAGKLLLELLDDSGVLITGTGNAGWQYKAISQATVGSSGDYTTTNYITVGSDLSNLAAEPTSVSVWLKNPRTSKVKMVDFNSLGFVSAGIVYNLLGGGWLNSTSKIGGFRLKALSGNLTYGVITIRAKKIN